MTIKEIFDSEKRNEDNLFDIHFYLEGSFWRAYEWSAYLSRNFPSELSEDNRLKVIKKTAKDVEEGFVQVGLQLSSFEKYFPNVINNEEIFEIVDKHIIIHAKSFFDGITFSKYEKIFSEWKENIKLTLSEKKKNKELFKKKVDISSIDSIINEIICYPIESSNLLDCLNFLSSIKNKLSKITSEINS